MVAAAARFSVCVRRYRRSVLPVLSPRVGLAAGRLAGVLVAGGVRLAPGLLAGALRGLGLAGVIAVSVSPRVDLPVSWPPRSLSPLVSRPVPVSVLAVSGHRRCRRCPGGRGRRRHGRRRHVVVTAVAVLPGPELTSSRRPAFRAAQSGPRSVAARDCRLAPRATDRNASSAKARLPTGGAALVDQILRPLCDAEVHRGRGVMVLGGRSSWESLLYVPAGTPASNTARGESSRTCPTRLSDRAAPAEQQSPGQRRPPAARSASASSAAVGRSRGALRRQASIASERLGTPARARAGRPPRAEETGPRAGDALVLGRPAAVERGGPRNGVVQGRPEPPDVRRRPDLARRAGCALLGRHVGLACRSSRGCGGRARRLRTRLRSISRGGMPITMLSGFTSRCTSLLARPGSGAPRRRGAASGSTCSGGQGAAALDQPPQRGALQVLDQQMWVWTVEHGVEAPHAAPGARGARAPPPPRRGRAAHARQRRGRAAAAWRPSPRRAGRPRRGTPRRSGPRQAASARSVRGRSRRPRPAPTSACRPLPGSSCKDQQHVIDFELTDEQRLIHETARDFADSEIVPARPRQRPQRALRHRAREQDRRDGLPRRDRARGVRRARASTTAPTA